MTTTAGIYISRENISGIKLEIDESNARTLHGHGVFDDKRIAQTKTFREPIEEPSILALKTIVRQLCESGNKPDLLGVACYGPFKSLDLDDRRLAQDGMKSGYGTISETSHFAPFAGWDLFSIFNDEFKRHGCEPEISIQTDVGASALAEWIYRSDYADENNGQSENHTVAYLNFTEGVGGAVVSNGKILNGALHPEMGQIPVKIHEVDAKTGFEGVCPHHKDCLEGLTSTRALAARLNSNVRLQDLVAKPDHPIWEIQAWYMAQLCTSVTLLLAPSVIVVGGKILQCECLLPYVRQWHELQLGGRDNDAFAYYSLLRRPDGFIQTSKMPHNPGLLGAVCLPLIHPGRRNIEAL